MTRLVTDPVIDGALNLIKSLLHRLPSWMALGSASRWAAEVNMDNAVKLTAASANSAPLVIDRLQERFSGTMSGPIGSRVMSLLRIFPGEIGFQYRNFSAKVTAFGMRDTASSRAAAIALGLFDLDLVLLLFAALGEQYLGSFGKSVADLVEQHGVVVKVSRLRRPDVLYWHHHNVLTCHSVAGILHVRRVACIPAGHGILPRLLYIAAIPFWYLALPVDSAVPQPDT